MIWRCLVIEESGKTRTFYPFKTKEQIRQFLGELKSSFLQIKNIKWRRVK